MAPDAPSAPAARPVTNLPANFIRKTVAGFLGVIDAWVVRRVKKVAGKLGAESDQIAEMTATVAMTKEESEIISTLTEVVARKHGMTDEIAPEALLCVAMGGYAIRTGVVMAQLEELSKARTKRENPPPAEIPKPSAPVDAKGQPIPAQPATVPDLPKIIGSVS